jgi:probable rRNA maturation factor
VAVAIRCETGAGRSFAAAVCADARQLLRAVGLPRCELSIVLTDDAAIRALNRDFRGIDRPTDVLSFPQIEDAATANPNEPLGDVVISLDTACRQAARSGIEPAVRVRTLLIHGFLHLLGYDHERSRTEARRMFARERELAKLLTREPAKPSRRTRRRCVAEVGR